MTSILTTGSRRAALVLLTLAAPLTSCDLSVPDPNSTTQDDAFNTRAGLIVAVTGLENQYKTQALSSYLLTTGITSRELAADNTFANLLDLDIGGAGLATNNGNVAGYFREMYQTISTATDIIEGATGVENVSPELRARLIATAEFYKAAALGALAIGFTDVALNTSRTEPVSYVGRQAGFEEANRLLASAEGRLAGGAEADLLNRVRAYRARFELFAGNLDEALAAANRVDPARLSVFTYQEGADNPLYQGISPIVGQPSFAVRDNLGLADVEAGDGRIDYFTEPNPDTSPNGLPIETATGFIVGDPFAPSGPVGPRGSIPAFVPDEMALIRAEVFARRSQTADAVREINSVRQDAADPLGLVPNLGPYTGPTDLQSLLDEIYYNRSTELYLQGLRLEDARRLNQGSPETGNPFQRTRNFYPFPEQERLANPTTTPADPAI